MAKGAVSIAAPTRSSSSRATRAAGRHEAIDRKTSAAFAAYAPEAWHRAASWRIAPHAEPLLRQRQTRDFALMVAGRGPSAVRRAPHQLYNMHPGKALSASRAGRQADGAELEPVSLNRPPPRCHIETMAGKPARSRGTFESWRAIIARVSWRATWVP